jgi:hypothetical protein
MKTYCGTVRNGVVKLPPGAHVHDGERVVLAVLSAPGVCRDAGVARQLEDEDVEFVRACRGRLATSLRAEDA